MAEPIQIQFEDVHPSYNVNGFACTNEEPSIHNMLLKSRRVKRAGGICSGGEIPLLVFAPRAEEVIAIDHSYRALAVTMFKMIMLNDLGPRAFKSLIFNTETGEFQKKIVQPYYAQLPEAIRAKITQATMISGYDFQELRREWYYVPLKRVAEVLAALGRVKLVHGDLTDLSKFGALDVFYMSNATDHLNRCGKIPKLDDMAPLVKPGGLMLATGNQQATKWDEVKKIMGLRSGWTHHLLRRKPEPARKVEVANAVTAPAVAVA